MIERTAAAVRHLDPIFKTLARARGTSRALPGAICRRRSPSSVTCTAGEQHRSFRQMIHNGIEYGIMASYAEGMNITPPSNVGEQQRAIDAETTPLRNPELYRYDLDLRDIAGGSMAAPTASSRHRCSTSPQQR